VDAGTAWRRVCGQGRGAGRAVGTLIRARYGAGECAARLRVLPARARQRTDSGGAWTTTSTPPRCRWRNCATAWWARAHRRAVWHELQRHGDHSDGRAVRRALAQWEPVFRSACGSGDWIPASLSGRSFWRVAGGTGADDWRASRGATFCFPRSIGPRVEAAAGPSHQLVEAGENHFFLLSKEARPRAAPPRVVHAGCRAAPSPFVVCQSRAAARSWQDDGNRSSAHRSVLPHLHLAGPAG